MAKISVTAADIAEGVPRDCAKCAVARAIERVLGMTAFWVQRDRVTVRKSAGKVVQVRLPAVVREFIAVFDAGGEVAPFSFNLNLEGLR